MQRGREAATVPRLRLADCSQSSIGQLQSAICNLLDDVLLTSGSQFASAFWWEWQQKKLVEPDNQNRGRVNWQKGRSRKMENVRETMDGDFCLVSAFHFRFHFDWGRHEPSEIDGSLRQEWFVYLIVGVDLTVVAS